MDENKPSIWWQRANWFFLLLMVLPGILPHSSSLDFAAARRVAGFRIAAIFIGFVGWVGTALIKRILYPPVRRYANPANLAPTRLVMPLPGEAVVSASPSTSVAANPWDSSARTAAEKAAASLPPPPPPDAPRFSARYQSTGGGFWSLDPWSLVFHSPTRTAFFVVPATLSVFSLLITIRFSWAAVWKTTVGTFLAWGAFIVMFGVVQYRKFFPTRDTIRHCEVTLTPDGLYDVTPTKTAFVKWEQVQAVRQYQNKMYVYWPHGVNSFPIAGFENETDAQMFFDAAQTLWKSRGKVIPDVLVVPPPPPALAFDL